MVHTDSSTTVKITTQVQFLKDFTEIDRVCEDRRLDKQLLNHSKTPADILVAFLRFYFHSFQTGYHVAYVGPGKDKCFFNKSDLDMLFHESYVSRKGRNDYDFTVCDPFNNTYNPAKITSSRNNDNKPFKDNFESALQKLIVKQKFIC